MKVKVSKGQFGTVYTKAKWYEGKEDNICIVVGCICVLFAIFSL